MLVVINLDFILPRLVPGNAAQILSGGFGKTSEIQVLQARYGLNDSVTTQYVIYMKGIFWSWPPNLGISFFYFPTTVTALISERIGWSLLLIVASLALSLVLVYGMALISAQNRGGKFEIGALYGSISLHSIPVYWLAMVLLWEFSVVLGWLPVTGSYDLNSPSGLGYVIGVVRHAILPVIALSLSLIGQNYLVLRGSMQEALKSDYVIAAKSRGLRGRIVASRYVVRNSLLPLVSLLTFSLSGLISRVVLVEVVFGYPGMGDLIIDGILNHDYPVLEGSFFVLSSLVVLFGLIGDILLVRLDPRLRS